MTTPDRILEAGAVRLMADTYRASIARRNALIEAGHIAADVSAEPVPVVICVDECAALYQSNRIDSAHLAVAEELLAARRVKLRRHWWHR